MTGRLVDMAFTLGGKQRVTLEINGDFREIWDKLHQEPVLDVEIKKHREKRSPSRWALPPRASANSGREPTIILAMFRSARAFLRAATMISRFWTMPMICRSNRGKGVVGW